MIPENLEIVQAYDSALLAANFAKTLEGLDLEDEEQFQNISLLIDKLDKHIQSTPDCDELRFWKVGVTGLRILRTEFIRQRMVLTESGNILDERERLFVLRAALKKEISKLSNKTSRINTAESRVKVNIDEDIEGLISFLRALPLPTIYFRKKKDERKQVHERKKTRDEHVSPLIRLIVYIDNSPLLTPQLLRPQLLYSLKFVVRGIGWPKSATKLHLDLPTTLSRNDYSVSKFELVNPNKKADEFEGELNGHIQFSSSQTMLSENVSFVARCAFELQDGQFYEMPVIGHNQLEFRIVDPKNSGFVSKYTRLDLHVVELLEKLRNDEPQLVNEFDDLIPLLEALTRLLGTYAQTAVFRDSRTIPESDFHAQVLRDLRLILGEDAQEHPKQAGGYTDIRYHGIIVEIKVEDKNGDRKYISERYTSQAAQYQSVEARQISTVLVLDLTPKDRPPSDIRNDILLVDIPTHGGDDNAKQYKSKAFVFVVNGNINKPSEYSRRKRKDK